MVGGPSPAPLGDLLARLVLIDLAVENNETNCPIVGFYSSSIGGVDGKGFGLMEHVSSLTEHVSAPVHYSIRSCFPFSITAS